MIVYGPVPSRRLGRSLGVNNIPLKSCSYSCIYCQVGLTTNLTIDRKEFYKPDDIYSQVESKINQLAKSKEKVDYISFVPDGEPTLDINLGKTITRLKDFGIKIAVITNATLITNKDVQDDLKLADWVSVKIDSVYEDIWHKTNRPHKNIDLDFMLSGIKEFAANYKGTLVTETMLVEGYNSSTESLYKTSLFVKELNPNKVYMLVPIRPPAVKLKKTEDNNLLTARQIFETINSNFELIDYNEGDNFVFCNNPEEELLSIIAVHPMRKDAVQTFLDKANIGWNLIEELKSSNRIIETNFNGNSYFKNNIKR